MNDIWIPAFAALLGSLIPTVANLVITLLSPRTQNRIELFQIRRELGKELLVDFQRALNAAHPDPDKELKEKQSELMAKLLETKLRAAMYFSPPVISKLDKMLLELNSGKKLEQQEFNDHFTGLINAMRREIKLDGITDFHVMIMRSAAS